MSEPKKYEATRFTIYMMCFTTFALGMCVGADIYKDRVHKEAVEAGVGQFNPKTGEFEYIKPEKKP